MDVKKKIKHWFLPIFQFNTNEYTGKSIRIHELRGFLKNKTKNGMSYELQINTKMKIW